MSIQSIEQQALGLPIEYHAKLAEKLLSSLDGLSESEIEKLWMTESQRRAEEIDSGLVELVSAQEIEDKIKAILQ